jgi:hypothetical protein
VKIAIPVVASSLLLTASLASAEVGKSYRALVVSFDGKAKTIRLRERDDAKPPKWTEVEAHWDAATQWKFCPEKIYQCEAATAGAASTTLKKDSKVYVIVNDQGSHEKTWYLESLKTLPPDETVP